MQALRRDLESARALRSAASDALRKLQERSRRLQARLRQIEGNAGNRDEADEVRADLERLKGDLAEAAARNETADAKASNVGGIARGCEEYVEDCLKRGFEFRLAEGDMSRFHFSNSFVFK
jgi:hypothetical protein